MLMIAWLFDFVLSWIPVWLAWVVPGVAVVVIVVVAVIAIGGGGVGDVALAKQPGTAFCADTKKLPKCKNRGRGCLQHTLAKSTKKSQVKQQHSSKEGKQPNNWASIHPSNKNHLQAVLAYVVVRVLLHVVVVVAAAVIVAWTRPGNRHWNKLCCYAVTAVGAAAATFTRNMSTGPRRLSPSI